MQLSKIDARIMRVIAAMQQLEAKLEPASAFDYRAILVPLVKSYMRVCFGLSYILVDSSYAFAHFFNFDGFVLLSFFMFSFSRLTWRILQRKMPQRNLMPPEKHFWQNLLLILRRAAAEEVIMLVICMRKQRIRKRARIFEKPRIQRFEFRVEISLCVTAFLVGSLLLSWSIYGWQFIPFQANSGSELHMLSSETTKEMYVCFLVIEHVNVNDLKLIFVL